MRFYAKLLLGLLGILEACASTETPNLLVSSSEQTPRRTRRRRRIANSDTGNTVGSNAQDGTNSPRTGGMQTSLAAPATSMMPTETPPAPTSAMAPATFGTPVVRASVLTVRPRYRLSEGNAPGWVECEGAVTSVAAPCSQCAQTPSSAAIVRAFYDREQAVLGCRPPADRRGRFSVQARVANSGAPLGVYFPGAQPDEETALCVARSLCTASLPNFRAPEASVNFDYVVLLAVEE